MKYWREDYLAKHKRKHSGGITVGDFDKFISYVHLNLQLLNLQLEVILMYAWCLSDVADMEAKAPL